MAISQKFAAVAQLALYEQQTPSPLAARRATDHIKEHASFGVADLQELQAAAGGLDVS
jgi:hypothetical protein